MKKVVSIIGARPNFIKAAAISKKLQASKFREVIVHTGQHFSMNMSDVFFKDLDIFTPNYYLNINMLSHGAMTGRMLEKIEEVLIDSKPIFVIVYGDTNSTLAGALAAVKLHIPVVHVEAGVRSFNKQMPEEINRIITDHISRARFCTSDESIRNLESEGLIHNNFVSGDVMYDVFLQYKDTIQNRKISRLDIQPKEYALVTIHREENTTDINKLYNIFHALSSIQYKFVIPLHPRTKDVLWKSNDFKDSLKKGNIFIIPPVGYLDMLYLELNSKLIITDSGGVQKEAYYAHVPSLILRNETEWVELVHEGYATLVGTEMKNIIKGFNSTMLSNIKFSDGLYGSGNSSNFIVEKLECFWGGVI